MSDGNFNRALLPHTDFQSGVRAGRAGTRHQAEEAFKKVISSLLPYATKEDKAQALELFRTKLLKNE